MKLTHPRPHAHCPDTRNTQRCTPSGCGSCNEHNPQPRNPAAGAQQQLPQTNNRPLAAQGAGPCMHPLLLLLRALQRLLELSSVPHNASSRGTPAHVRTAPTKRHTQHPALHALRLRQLRRTQFTAPQYCSRCAAAARPTDPPLAAQGAGPCMHPLLLLLLLLRAVQRLLERR
jgi:hypothetical protein